MKIGLAVGHSRKGDEGAMTARESGYSISEFTFNSDLVRRIAPALTMDYVIYNDYKDPTYVGAVDYLAQKLIDDEIDAVVELHYLIVGHFLRKFKYRILTRFRCP